MSARTRSRLCFPSHARIGSSSYFTLLTHTARRGVSYITSSQNGQQQRLERERRLAEYAAKPKGSRSDDAAPQNMQLNRNGVVVPVLTSLFPASPRTLKKVIFARITRAEDKMCGRTPKPQSEEEQASDCGEYPYVPYRSDEACGERS
jgi:hypothetical protein